MKNHELIDLAKSLIGEIFLANGGSAGGVGAALLTAKGNVYSGICLDYSCGLGFCAEHAAVAEMLKHRETEIAKIVAVNKDKILPPCGRCRELIILTNSSNRNTEVIISQSKTMKLFNLLPYHWLEN
ncbi:Cytidine deaminase protein [Hyella patelloides LEGE 07179]|uniref:Cytidine deaminase protein n=1 Tax=Hyella patelloides LEGE 07179 TaxID=945734 RepID=A0A563VWS4_9CYAN|nr:cytidine deaminase [Hyella patelloides]VEP15703.1 Cytidine deaminase protein [Hyella patelloides LEGE 07179]